MLHRKKFAQVVLHLQQQENISASMLAMLSRIEIMRLKRIVEGEVSPTLEEASAIVHVFGKELIID